MFRNRMEAGILLAAKLRKYKNDHGIVLAVLRGGVPVAYAVAKELDFPMELVLAKKIGHPINKEYAIGAASLNDHFVIPHENVSDEYIRKEIQQVRKTLRDMHKKFIGNTEPESLAGKTVILVDDGIATGNTLMGTVTVLRKAKPAKIIIAVPVASMAAVQRLSTVVDEVVVGIIPETFYGVGAFYDDFEQVSDEKAMLYIDQLHDFQKSNSKIR